MAKRWVCINAGDYFSTAHETGCYALEDWNEDGAFMGLDSDGVRVMFHAAMVISVDAILDIPTNHGRIYPS